MQQTLRDTHSIPGSGRTPGEGNGSPLQYSCLKNLMDRGAWQATVHGVAKRWTWLSDYQFHFDHRLRHRPLICSGCISHLLSWSDCLFEVLCYKKCFDFLTVITFLTISIHSLNTITISSPFPTVRMVSWYQSTKWKMESKLLIPVLLSN